MRSPPFTHRFIASEAGSILPFFAFTLVVIMGILAMTYDMGRMAATQAELQSFADSVALAAAGELDGNSDAITRASNAAAAMINDTATYGIEDDVLSGPDDYVLTFLTGRPIDGVLSGLITTDARRARFVHVAVTPQNVQASFGAAFTSLSGEPAVDGSVGAQAAAGFSLVACDITPLMFCMPNANFQAKNYIGTTIKMRSGGSGAAWGPGDFGFLDPSASQIDQDGVCAGLSGSRLDSCLTVAVGNRLGCFDQSGVTTRPGQSVGNAEAALNVLFDIYAATMNSNRNDPVYAPAPSVISGYIPNTGRCIGSTATVSPNTVGLPVDDCFTNGSCSRFGDGAWGVGRQNYVQTNYGTADPYPTAQTRYAYYMAELAANGGGGVGTPILRARAENGRPRCAPTQSPNPARRVLVAAAVDCAANNIQGRTENVPVREFVEIFMLRPVGLDGTADVYVEIIGAAGGGSGGNATDSTVRDVVRLVQ